MTFKPSIKIPIATLFVALVIIIGLVFWYILVKGNTFERQIGKQIIKNCGTSGKTCVVKIQDITKFHWDKMYVFSFGTGEEDIASIIGVKPPISNNGDRKIIFVNQNKVVLYEDLPTSFEHTVNNQVLFDFPNDKDYTMFTPETGIFNAKVGKNQWGSYYSLTRVEQ